MESDNSMRGGGERESVKEEWVVTLDGVWRVKVGGKDTSARSGGGSRSSEALPDDDVGGSSSWVSLDGGIINIQYLQWCCARSCLEFFCLLSLAMGTDGWRRWNNKLEVNNPKLVQANSNGLKKMSVLPKKVDIVYKMFWVANTCGSLCSVQTACWVFHLLLWLVGDW